VLSESKTPRPRLWAAVERAWHMRKCKPDSGLGFQVKVHETFSIAPSLGEANGVFDPGEAKIVRHEENLAVFSRGTLFLC